MVILVAVLKQGGVNIPQEELWEYCMPKSPSYYDKKTCHMLLCISKRLLSFGSCGFLPISDIYTAVQQHDTMPILNTINELQQSPYNLEDALSD